MAAVEIPLRDWLRPEGHLAGDCGTVKDERLFFGLDFTPAQANVSYQ